MTHHASYTLFICENKELLHTIQKEGVRIWKTNSSLYLSSIKLHIWQASLLIVSKDYCLLSHRVKAISTGIVFASSKSPKHSTCISVSSTRQLEDTMQMFPGSSLSGNAKDYCLFSHRVKALHAGIVFAISKSAKHSPLYFCIWCKTAGKHHENVSRQIPVWKRL